MVFSVFDTLNWVLVGYIVLLVVLGGSVIFLIKRYRGEKRIVEQHYHGTQIIWEKIKEAAKDFYKNIEPLNQINFAIKQGKPIVVAMEKSQLHAIDQRLREQADTTLKADLQNHRNALSGEIKQIKDVVHKGVRQIEQKYRETTLDGVSQVFKSATHTFDNIDNRVNRSFDDFNSKTTSLFSKGDKMLDHIKTCGEDAAKTFSKPMKEELRAVGNQISETFVKEVQRVSKGIETIERFAKREEAIEKSNQRAREQQSYAESYKQQLSEEKKRVQQWKDYTGSLKDEHKEEIKTLNQTIEGLKKQGQKTKELEEVRDKKLQFFEMFEKNIDTFAQDPTAFWVLVLKRKGLSHNQVGEIIDKKKNTVSDAMKRLEKKGFGEWLNEDELRRRTLNLP